METKRKAINDLSITELNDNFWQRGIQTNVAWIKGELCVGFSNERF